MDTLMKKQLADGNVLVVGRDEGWDPTYADSRDAPVTRIVGWDTHYPVDDRPDVGYEDFVRNLYVDEFSHLRGLDEAAVADFIRRTAYPGLLYGLHAKSQSHVIIDASPCGDPLAWGYSQVGFIYATPQMMSDEGIGRDTTLKHLNTEVAEWENDINGNVYSLDVMRRIVCDGAKDHFETTESLGGLNPGTQTLDTYMDEVAGSLLPGVTPGGWHWVP